MTPMDRPDWERLDAGDFRVRLEELSRAGERRLFHPLDAGSFVVSIQASADHDFHPRGVAAAATEIEAWEVAVYNGEGLLLHEGRDQELVRMPAEWLRYWRAGIGRYVPTAVLHAVLDRLTLGPDAFDRFVLDGPD